LVKNRRRLRIHFKEVSVSKKLDKKKKKTPEDDQKLRKNKRTIALAFWALGTILLILLIGKLFVVLASLNKPFTEDFKVAKTYTWNGTYSVNVVVKADDLSLINYDPVNSLVTVIKVPDDTQISLPKGYGNYPASSIYELGEAERPPVGASLIKASFAHLFGLPVDGFILVEKSEKFHTIEEFVEQSRHSPLSVVELVSHIKTDLSPLETFKLFAAINRLRQDKIQYVDIGRTNITESKLLPDTTRVLGIDSIHLDLFVRQRLKDQSMVADEISIAIFNATDHPGLAQEAARVITNLGGNVISVNNTSKLLETSQVIAAKNSKEKSRIRLSQMFAPQCVKGGCSSDDDKVISSRADITVVLGEDYFKRRSDKAYPF
jgi:hypothetical protein